MTTFQRRGRVVLVVAIIGALWVLATTLAGAYHRQQETRATERVRLGHEALAADRLADGAEHFRTAVALAPGRPDYQLHLAKALLSLGRLGEAERYLLDVLRADATNGDAQLALARVQRDQGRDADAEASYYRAIYGRWPADAEPTRMQTRLELIDLLARTAAPDRVRAELVQLATSFPGDRTLQLRVGRQLIDIGFPGDAARLFQTMVQRFADPGGAYAGLAEAEIARRDYAAAAEAARQALSRDPDDAASAARLTLATTVAGLDPNQPRLSTRERLARTRRLLDLARARLDACWEGRELDATRQDLRARMARPRTGAVTPLAVDEEAALLDAAARAVVAECLPDGADQPVDRAFRLVAGAGAP